MYRRSYGGGGGRCGISKIYAGVSTNAYGNSALHYLAAHHMSNKELIAYLRAREEQKSVGSNTWKEARNL